MTSTDRLTTHSLLIRIPKTKEVGKTTARALIWEKSFFFHFFASHCLSVTVQRFGCNDHLSVLFVPCSDYRLGGVLQGSQEGMLVLFTSSVSPSHSLFLSPSQCTPSEASQQGGILLFQDECTRYRKHPLACFTLGWADRHKSLCRWEKGGELRTCFFYFYIVASEDERHKSTTQERVNASIQTQGSTFRL